MGIKNDLQKKKNILNENKKHLEKYIGKFFDIF
jgi:hypothetical protein